MSRTPRSKNSKSQNATVEELEVADAAHFMGYELARCTGGYVLCRKYGSQYEVIKAPTLKDVTEQLKH
jgi:hypothetical protein